MLDINRWASTDHQDIYLSTSKLVYVSHLQLQILTLRLQKFGMMSMKRKVEHQDARTKCGVVVLLLRPEQSSLPTFPFSSLPVTPLQSCGLKIDSCRLRQRQLRSSAAWLRPTSTARPARHDTFNTREMSFGNEPSQMTDEVS